MTEGETLMPEIGMRILRRAAAPDDEIHNSFNTFFFQSDSIRGKIFVTCGAGGDSIRLQGRGCTKSLKKLYQEKKLPLPQRMRNPVLFDDEGPIAVFGFGIAERCAAVPGGRAEIIEITKI